RLQDLEQDLTGLAGLAVGLFVVTAELLLQDAVDAAGLLLLTKLEQVLAVLGAAAAVLTRRVRPDLDRALRGLALAALEEQLHLLPPAAAAVGTSVTGHEFVLSFSGPGTRRRAGGEDGVWRGGERRRAVLAHTRLRFGGGQAVLGGGGAGRGLPAP